MTLLSIILPGLTFLKRREIFSAILAILLQLTIIGWLPAVVWAVTANNNLNYKRSVNQYHY